MNPADEIPAAEWCERCGVKLDLRSVITLQRLLAGISSEFVTASLNHTDEAIDRAQRLIGETLDIDRSTLWQATDDGEAMALTHFWQKAGCVPLRRNYVSKGNLPWCDRMLMEGRSFHFSTLADLPPEASKDVETLRLHGTKSNVTFPLTADGKVFGALAFGMTLKERQWTADEIESLKLISEVFGHVIRRQRAEQRAEQLRSEIQGGTRASLLGEIAAALAHEINQPLTTILSNAQAARRFLVRGAADRDEIIHILDDIIRDDKRAGAVIQNLRAMLSDAPVPFESTVVNSLVSEVCESLTKALRQKKTTLEFELSDSLPKIQLIRVEIQQVLHNLILNAVQSMEGTPVEDRRIRIRTRRSGGRLHIQVADRGHGISPERIDRIFEPFHSTRSGGLGMGLAICRRIADGHGGKLTAINNESGGAEFSLELPLTAG